MTGETNPDRVRQIYEMALDKPAAARSGFLDRVCGEEGELRERVEALLAANEDLGDFLAEPTGGVPATPEPEPDRADSGEEAGDTIDRYKLLQKIGEGGMGEVWMAEQYEPVRRKVALKIIKLGMDTRQVVVRFEAERQALAMMDHPSIAKVLDGGMTETGRPYFAMELVKGVPITEFCDDAKFDLRQRLDLFTEVCSAVQHAHQKGIIHRDIKPSNVLVTLHDGKPVPKVIDFGIAKATNQELTQKTLFTEYQQILGTPEYMAPEQASMSGLDVDTRADIYSLGALLYELLTGTKPFDLNTLLTQGYEELLRTIREEDPPKPSTRASATEDDTGRISMVRQMGEGQLGKALRGDLDWIIVKSMEKDRTRRYDSANGLAADVRRFLANEPVTAMPPSAAYRTRKFVRRHRSAVVAGSIIVLLLIGGVVGTASALVRALNAEEETALELARANEVKSVIKEMIAGIRPDEAQGRDTSLLKGILDRTLERLENGEIKNVEIQAELELLLGNAYAAIGELALAEKLCQRSADKRTELFGADSQDTVMSRMQLALAWTEQGRIRESTVLNEELLPHVIRHWGPDSMEAIGHRVNLSQLYWQLGYLQKALDEGERAYADARRALGEDSDYAMNAGGNLALTYRSLNRFDDARKRLEEAIELRTRIDGENHPALISLQLNLALLHLQQNRLDEADAVLSKAEALRAKLYRPDQPVSSEVPLARVQLLTERGRILEAEQRLLELIAMLERTLTEEHKSILLAYQQLSTIYAMDGQHAKAAKILEKNSARAMRAMGVETIRAQTFVLRDVQSLLKLSRFEQARGILEKVRAERLKSFGADDERTLLVDLQLARALVSLNRHEDAARVLDPAIASLRRQFGNDDLRTQDARRTHALLLTARNEWNEAEATYKELEELSKDDPERLADLYEEMGKFYALSARPPLAEAAFRKRAKVLEAAHGPAYFPVALTRRQIAYLLHMQGRYEAAKREYKLAIDGLSKSLGPDSTATLEARCRLSISLGAQRRFKEAEALLLDVKKIAEESVGGDHLIMVEVNRCLGMVYMDWMRLPDAERVLNEAVAIETRLSGSPSAQDLDRLAQCANARKDTEAEHAFVVRAVEAARKQVPRDSLMLVRMLVRKAKGEEQQGRPEDALGTLEEAQTVAKRGLPTKHPIRLQAIGAAGALLSRLDRLEEAVHVLSEALALNRSVGGAGSPAALQALPPLALALHSLGRYAEVEKIVKEGLEASAKSMGGRNFWAGFFHLILSSSAREQGQFDKAAAEHEKARKIVFGMMGPRSLQACLVRMNRAQLFVAQENYAEARKAIEPCAAFFASTPPSNSWRRSVELQRVAIYDALDETKKAAAVLKQVLPHQLDALKLPTDRREALFAAATALLYERYVDTYDPKRGLELAHQALEAERRAKAAGLWRRYLLLADAQMKNGDEAGARRSLTEAAKHAPEAYRAHLAKETKEILG